MGWESFGVVIFDLGPLLQGQMRIAKLKSAYNSLIIGVQVWDGKPTYRKSLVGKLFIDIADIYCFGTGLPISRHVFQYRHFK